MTNKNKLSKRHGAISAAVAVALLAAFWIGAPSSHSERPSPSEISATESNDVRAILENETIAPDTSAAAPAPLSPLTTTELTVARGDTLMAMLVGTKITRNDAHAAITALTKEFQPRDLKPGLRVAVTMLKSAEGPVLQQIKLAIDPQRDITVRRDDNGTFAAAAIERPLTTSSERASGIIHSSLYLAGQRAGLAPTVLADLIRIFSFDVDFQRDVQPNDSFDIMYERRYDEAGIAVVEGNILIAEMMLSGKKVRLYRYRTSEGDIDYFDNKGRSVRKALILTPIDGARISSGYGRRRHPILGYTKMHRGIDFAAPRGTPVYAAGHGTIEVAGRNGGYGKYVRIRHNGSYKTAYAHLKGYARGIRRGKRVRQGQVIGYVGSTGRSTGPHLHYEILHAGRQMNPKRLNLPSGRKLAGAELKRFRTARIELERQYATLPAVTQTAKKCGTC
ncbi:MAG: peptidoglycan DD-metalloendopeptidase family protein [Alphaproteobacteria bacterium]|nr:peptidoglycan DD-metalloendopeptidase family protein [Alphaproteobacteria bacterium]